MSLENLRTWLLRKLLNAVSPKIDYSIKRGDIVTSKKWDYTPLEIIDVNWALRAVALRLGPNGGIVVWPVWGLKKVRP